MKTEVVRKNNTEIAIVSSDELLISSLDANNYNLCYSIKKQKYR